MSDLSIQIPEISREVVEKHKNYIKKFEGIISLVEGEFELSRTRIRSKLDLLIGVFKNAGIIDDVFYGVVSSRDGVFPMSMGIGKSGNPVCLYLLNTGADIIVSDSIGLALSLNTLDAKIVLVTQENRVGKKFSNVLDPNFDWKNLATYLLDSIHATIYDKHEVVKKGLSLNLQ